MECLHCQSEKTVKNGKDYHQDGKAIQNYSCNGCGKRFNERTGTPMSRLRSFLCPEDEDRGDGNQS
jgi:transposase-like protein